MRKIIFLSIFLPFFILFGFKTIELSGYFSSLLDTFQNLNRFQIELN